MRQSNRSFQAELPHHGEAPRQDTIARHETQQVESTPHLPRDTVSRTGPACGSS